jgi:hypothetical protein
MKRKDGGSKAEAGLAEAGPGAAVATGTVDGAAPENARPLGVSMSSGRPLFIMGEEAVCGISITGAIGTGKTEGVLKAFIDALLADPAAPGALILNAKDDYGVFVRARAAAHGVAERVVHLVAEGEDTMNILAEWMPSHKLAEIIVSSAAVMDRDDPYWTLAATNLLTDEIELLRLAYGAEAVTLTDVLELHTMLCQEIQKRVSPVARRTEIPDGLVLHLEAAAERNRRLPELERAGHDERVERRRNEFLRWLTLNDRTFSSIGATLDVALAAVKSDQVGRVLCAPAGEATFTGVTEILSKGRIVVLDFPPQRDGEVGRLAGRLLKRQLFAAAARERGHGFDPTRRPVFFIADEAQNFIDTGNSSESDHNFAAIARSLRCGLILSTQEVGAYYTNTSRPEAVHNLLRNLRTHITFRQDASPELLRLFDDRGLPRQAALSVPHLDRFHAFVSRKNLFGDETLPARSSGRAFDQVRFTAWHRRGETPEIVGREILHGGLSSLAAPLVAAAATGR